MQEPQQDLCQGARRRRRRETTLNTESKQNGECTHQLWPAHFLTLCRPEPGHRRVWFRRPIVLGRSQTPSRNTIRGLRAVPCSMRRLWATFSRGES